VTLDHEVGDHEVGDHEVSDGDVSDRNRSDRNPSDRNPSDRAGMLHGFDAEELIEDFRVACVSRAIDDREISMQKQNRVFFQISGAGHEALGLALARLLRPGYDWFFPYYREQALVLGLGISVKDILLQAVGSADDPPDAEPLGPARGQPRHPVEPDRQPVHPGRRLRGGGPLHRPPTAARPAGPRRRAHVRQPR
jgi:hypothetical protein